jgi:hypothetical protein
MTPNESLLLKLQHAIDLCLLEKPEAVIDAALTQLRTFQSTLQQGQPLALNQIFIGAFAAKNLDDWNPALATVLMYLDSHLKQHAATSSPTQIASPKTHPPSA